MISSNKAIIPQLLEFTADRNNGGWSSDRVNMAKLSELCALFIELAGGTGTCDIVVKAYAAATGGSPYGTNIKFRAKATLAGLLDVFDTKVPSDQVSTYTTVAGAQKCVAFEIDPRDVPAGYPFIEFQGTENVNSPVLAGMVGIGTPRRVSDPVPTVLT